MLTAMLKSLAMLNLLHGERHDLSYPYPYRIYYLSILECVEMKIIQVTKNIVDVFVGEGWENWIRLDLRSFRVLGKNNIQRSVEKTIINELKGK